eukprot:CAMPEP_0174329344 /NCGR_PEP_ID=MMETSP0810-20121108/15766_1 /TAXON_ID=73025 ORGANISM="Eutreptiella gymnastica-like, Strain CCMP1594" /NCGR_SAMPLE_ID=MMETSP0810 /ASSEMBLY_ACC=CAM_ASM_000659 /LENGTH=675 /DNA_ID=CAMNT_0015443783 /DNA_START=76 /DNA_END=2103 /DNA_ORIENTATION=-
MGRITLFKVDGDGQCDEVSALFKELGAAAVEIDLVEHPLRRAEMIHFSKGCKKVPLVFFNDTLIGGRDAVFALHSTGHLAGLIEGCMAGQESSAPALAIPSCTSTPTGYGQDRDMADPDSRDMCYGHLMAMLRHNETGLSVANRSLNMKVYKNCFVGSELVDWLIRHVDSSLSRPNAVARAQTMMDAALFNHVDRTLAFADAYVFYRFMEDEEIVVLNEGAQQRDTPTECHELAMSICTSLHLATHSFTDSSGIDYQGLAGSEDWASFVRLTTELQSVDLMGLVQNERLALYITMYNALALHATVAQGPPHGPMGCMAFLNTNAYNIGGHVYTLNDIYHGLLRHNRVPPGTMRRPFGPSDPRCHFMIPLDPRIHFVLNPAVLIGRKTLKAYSHLNVTSELQAATEECLERLQISPSKEVRLHILFHWYDTDFGAEDKDVLEWAKPFLFRDKRKKLQETMEAGGWSVVYEMPIPNFPVEARGMDSTGGTKPLEVALQEVSEELKQQQPAPLGQQRGPYSQFALPPAYAGYPHQQQRPPRFGGPVGTQWGPPMPRAWEQFRAIEITLEYLKMLKFHFQQADRHRRGFLDINDLGEWARSQGAQVDLERLQKMIDQVDVNRRGVVTFWAFLGIQIYLAMGMQATTNVRDWMQFVTQSHDPSYDPTVMMLSSRGSASGP